MTSLLDIIRGMIEQNGPLSVATFMSLALGHPEHGYYMKKDPFGTSGDFTTAPEISQMFGELIGLWTADLWQRMGSPQVVQLIEAGPGRGTLMADALRATHSIPGFHAALSIGLLETSPVLRQRQAEALKDYSIVWHERADECFAAGEGPLIIIANEFLDALPVHQLQVQDRKWQERRIGLNAEGIPAFGLTLAENALLSLLPEQSGIQAREGDIAELSPAVLGFTTELCKALAKRRGAALLIDYGYETPGLGDTLQAVKNHRFVSVLEDPGNADITAHVNFKSIADAVLACRCTSFGPVGQGAFLKSIGIEPRTEKLLQQADKNQGNAIQSAYERLTSETQMGSLFKVMAVMGPTMPEPAGFR